MTLSSSPNQISLFDMKPETRAALSVVPSSLPIGKLVVAAGTYFQNPRTATGLDKESMKEITSDIGANDIDDPVQITFVKLIDETGCTDAFGKTTLRVGVIALVIDGQRRLLGAVGAGYKADDEVPVVLVSQGNMPDQAPELDMAVGSTWMLRATKKILGRKQLSSYELTQVAYKAREAGKSNDVIGKEIHKSATWVSRFLTAKKNASPELDQAWKEGKITDEQVKDLAAIPAEKQIGEVKRLTVVRETGDRAAKGTARATVKAKVAETKGPTIVKHAPPVQKALLELAELRVELKPKDKYAAGVADGVAYAVGAIGDKDLGAGFRAWLDNASKERHKKQAKEQSKKLTLEAQKAMAKKSDAKAPKAKPKAKAKK